MSTNERAAICELPPSAKLVFKVLEYGDAHTQKELVEKSRLSARTVRSALERLTDIGAVEEDIYIPDARQRLYQLDDSRNWDCVDCFDAASD